MQVGLIFDKRFLLDVCHKEEDDLSSNWQKPYLHFEQKGYEKLFEKIHVEKEATDEVLSLVHSRKYIDFISKKEFINSKDHPNFKLNKEQASNECHIQRASEFGEIDTVVCQHSPFIQRLMTSSLIELSMSVLKGQVYNGFAISCAGHHSVKEKAQGLSIYNHLCVTINYIHKNVDKNMKILVFDWDVHHGDGNSEILLDHPNVLVISMHRYDGGMFYPTTGHVEQTGNKGMNVNIAWGQGKNEKGRMKGNSDYLYAFNNIVMPIAREFGPDLIFIESGFDSAQGDPIGCMNVTKECYSFMLHELMNLKEGKVICYGQGKSIILI